MPPETNTDRPPVCDYEGSDYQQRFWDQADRQYEDRVEAIALQRLLPKSGKLLLEVGAGAGRNTPRYGGYERIVLLDFSTTQLEQAQARLGATDRYIYVAADVYSLPFVDGLFDAATMIRVIHHMAEPIKALAQVRQVLRKDGTFVLEYANKRNLKAILRYWLGRQQWNPFDQKPVEFVPLNFDFHPKAMRRWLHETQFAVERQLTVSHFRADWAKRMLPLGLLVKLDSLFQPTGSLWQYTPSVFVRSRGTGETPSSQTGMFFKCPACETALPIEEGGQFACPTCGRRWGIKNGIYNFKEPLDN
jgi:ubiquinone/menaquinone biosynthesis C-methylase UbiE